VGNVHLMKGQAYSQETNPDSRQRGCYIRPITTKIQLKKRIYGRESQGASSHDELIGGKPSVVK
jgi:hypothetical protein